MTTMNFEEQAKCHAIIHAASVSAGAVGAGLAQVPFSDSAVIIPIQVAMIIGLGRVFGIELTESAAGSVLAEGMATYSGRAISQLLIGWIPVAGNIVNACTAASVTEALGWLIASDFEKRAAGSANA